MPPFPLTWTLQRLVTPLTPRQVINTLKKRPDLWRDVVVAAVQDRDTLIAMPWSGNESSFWRARVPTVGTDGAPIIGRAFKNGKVFRGRLLPPAPLYEDTHVTMKAAQIAVDEHLVVAGWTLLGRRKGIL